MANDLGLGPADVGILQQVCLYLHVKWIMGVCVCLCMFVFLCEFNDVSLLFGNVLLLVCMNVCTYMQTCVLYDYPSFIPSL